MSPWIIPVVISWLVIDALLIAWRCRAIERRLTALENDR